MRISRRIVATALAACLLASLPIAVSVAKKPVNRSKIGYYLDSQITHQVTIQVKRNKHGKRQIKSLSMACPSTTHAPGTIELKNVKISKAGTFKVDGKLKVTYVDSKTLKAKLKITGTFKKTSVTGSLKPTGDDGLCDAMDYDADYFGNPTGG